MTEIKVVCAEYGVAMVLPVTVSHDAHVDALQEAIHDSRVKPFLHSGIVDTMYDEMFSTWTLTNVELLGPEFGPRDNEIHVLVELPPPQETLVVDPEWIEVHELCLRHVLFNPPTTLLATKAFKKTLRAAYKCYVGDGRVRLFLRLANVHDKRNGLLLFKPLKHAFDQFQLSFLYDHKSDAFRLKMFDPSVRQHRLFGQLDTTDQAILLQDQALPKHWTKTRGPRRAPGTDLQTTFGDLEGRALCLRSLTRPYKRSLNLQARLARLKAIENAWIERDEDDFEDFWREGMSLQRRWRCSMPVLILRTKGRKKL